LSDPPDGLAFSEHLEHGEALFRHACRLGLEGIISKRLGSPYRSGRSLMWRKIKCPSYERPG
jgi:bifunctional non-homologous end joining protein LigD